MVMHVNIEMSKIKTSASDLTTTIINSTILQEEIIYHFLMKYEEMGCQQQSVESVWICKCCYQAKLDQMMLTGTTYILQS